MLSCHVQFLALMGMLDNTWSCLRNTVALWSLTTVILWLLSDWVFAIRQGRWGKMHIQNIFFKDLRAIPSHIKAKWSTDPLLYYKKVISKKPSKTFCQYSIPFDSASYKIRCKTDYLGSLEPNFQAAFQCLWCLKCFRFQCLHNLFFIPCHRQKSFSFRYFISLHNFLLFGLGQNSSKEYYKRPILLFLKKWRIFF